ncbi:hypothetical protein [Nonomuraea sp. KM88]
MNSASAAKTWKTGWPLVVVSSASRLLVAHVGEQLPSTGGTG